MKIHAGKVTSITRMRVIGSGVMGSGIAQLAATRGVDVELADQNPAALAAAEDRLAVQLARNVSKGRMTEDEAEATRDRIRAVDNPMARSEVDLVVEAVKENLEVKHALFRELEEVYAPNTIFATNTSSLSVTAIGQALQDPGRLAGLHFFNPAPLMRVVEVVPGQRTAEPVVDALVGFVRELGHHAVRTADTPGFVVNHAGRGLVTEGLQILDEGVATAADIDRVARDVLGLKMGPFELLDLTGLDVSHPVLESIWSGFYGEPRLRPSPTTRARLQGGLLGRKSGEGFFTYRDGVKQEAPEPAPPAYEGEPVWVDDTALADLLRGAGVRLDSGPRPQEGSVVVITPFGESVSAAGEMAGLPLGKVVGVDPLDGFAGRLTMAVHPGVAPAAGRAALSALAMTGHAVTVTRDAPATVAQRLLASMVNTAAEIAHRRIASATDIDIAVRLGLGYPQGPLSWGEKVGAGRILRILEAQQQGSGDPRYRPSRWITERALIGVPLTDEGLALADLYGRPASAAAPDVVGASL